MPEAPAVEAIGLSRTFRAGGTGIRGLADVSLTIAPGEVVAGMGASGPGESTLLQIPGGLDDPDEGRAPIARGDWRSPPGRAPGRLRPRPCGVLPPPPAPL